MKKNQLFQEYQDKYEKGKEKIEEFKTALQLPHNKIKATPRNIWLSKIGKFQRRRNKGENVLNSNIGALETDSFKKKSNEDRIVKLFAMKIDRDLTS